MVGCQRPPYGPYLPKKSGVYPMPPVRHGQSTGTCSAHNRGISAGKPSADGIVSFAGVGNRLTRSKNEDDAFRGDYGGEVVGSALPYGRSARFLGPRTRPFALVRPHVRQQPGVTVL